MIFRLFFSVKVQWDKTCESTPHHKNRRRCVDIKIVSFTTAKSMRWKHQKYPPILEILFCLLVWGCWCVLFRCGGKSVLWCIYTRYINFLNHWSVFVKERIKNERCFQIWVQFQYSSGIDKLYSANLLSMSIQNWKTLSREEIIKDCLWNNHWSV